VLNLLYKDSSTTQPMNLRRHGKGRLRTCILVRCSVMERARVLGADDHAVVRHGIVALIAAAPVLQVVGTASDGLEAVERAREHRPDLIVMDISMPRLDGITATRQVREAIPATQVLGLSTSQGWDYVEAMLKAGAAGYVLKFSAPTVLLDPYHPDCSRGRDLS
jgi:DNA-binding NarL/FixJ family response regulator